MSMVRKMRAEPQVMAHTFNPSNEEAEAGKSDFKASLASIVSSRPHPVC